MNIITIKQLPLSESINIYKEICKDLAERFATKHDLKFDYFIGDRVGETASFSLEYCFSMCDIIFDFESEQESGKAAEWYGYVLDNSPKFDFEINYQSYCKGCRY